MENMPVNHEYDATAKRLHWAIAALVAIEFITVYAIPGSLIESGNPLRVIHIFLGIVVLALVVVRIWWRAAHRIPALPPHYDTFHRVLLRGVHYLFYALLFVLPLSGWMWVSSWSGNVVILGFLSLPDIVADDSPYGALAASVHRISAYVFGALLLVHLAGSVYSYLFTDDHMMDRMLPLSAREHRSQISSNNS